MSKKDYEIIAHILNDDSLHLGNSKKAALASRFATVLSVENERFNVDKFLEACGVED